MATVVEPAEALPRLSSNIKRGVSFDQTFLQSDSSTENVHKTMDYLAVFQKFQQLQKEASRVDYEDSYYQRKLNRTCGIRMAGLETNTRRSFELDKLTFRLALERDRELQHYRLLYLLRVTNPYQDPEELAYRQFRVTEQARLEREKNRKWKNLKPGKPDFPTAIDPMIYERLLGLRTLSGSLKVKKNVTEQEKIHRSEASPDYFDKLAQPRRVPSLSSFIPHNAKDDPNEVKEFFNVHPFIYNQHHPTHPHHIYHQAEHEHEVRDLVKDKAWLERMSQPRKMRADPPPVEKEKNQPKRAVNKNVFERLSAPRNQLTQEDKDKMERAKQARLQKLQEKQSALANDSPAQSTTVSRASSRPASKPSTPSKESKQDKLPSIHPSRTDISNVSQDKQEAKEQTASVHSSHASLVKKDESNAVSKSRTSLSQQAPIASAAVPHSKTSLHASQHDMKLLDETKSPSKKSILSLFKASSRKGSQTIEQKKSQHSIIQAEQTNSRHSITQAEQTTSQHSIAQAKQTTSRHSITQAVDQPAAQNIPDAMTTPVETEPFATNETEPLAQP